MTAAKLDAMSFADDLMKRGFRHRFQRIEIPFVVRADDEDEDEETEDEENSEETGDGLTLRGLAVPFDSPTRIRDWMGDFDEVFERGAFKRTIGQGHQVMLFEHGEHPLFGSLPIAEIRRLEETEKGLEVTARMFNNWMTEPLQDAIRSQAVSGMSIQFRSVKELIEEREDDVPEVRVQEADLRELGPVLFPAYSATSVELRKDFNDSVRQAVEETLRRFDENPSGGVPKRESVGPGKSHLTRNRFRLAQARLQALEGTT